MTKNERAKLIEKAIRDIWGSLETHLDGAYLKTPEGKKFHVECVKSYAEQIVNQTKLYD